MQFAWPLATNNFTILDRLKIAAFFLNPKKRWTQGEYVKKYEQMAADYVGVRYAVYVSSGSTANQLICQKIKDDLIKRGEWKKRNKVILGAISWQTNASVWIREGFEPVFIDVNLQDFCFNYEKLGEYLKNNHHSVAAVFPTAVLGFTPDVEKLKSYELNYPKIKFSIDCCENFFGEFDDMECKNLLRIAATNNICSSFTSSTSCFIAHQITNGQEGGFIFTNSGEEYEYYLLSRAHGLLRNLDTYKKIVEDWKSVNNILVNRQFDFQLLSSNYRGTDISAFCGILDFKRIPEYKKRRTLLWDFYRDQLDANKYLLPPYRTGYRDIIFSFPIILKGNKKDNRIRKVEELLKSKNIEYRPFISGNMLRQLPYQKYGNYKTFKNAEYLTKWARYVGFNMELNIEDINDLCNELNKI